MSETYSNSHNSDKFVNRYAERFNLDIDKDWTNRESKLHIYNMFLEGTIYDNLSPFHQEYQGQGDSSSYIKLCNRRPSVIYRIPKIIVDESTSMLFGCEHFPVVRCEHEKTTEFLQYITNHCHLKYSMLNAAKIGSVGSVCLLIKVLEEKFYFEVLGTADMQPYFNPMRPDELVRIVQRKKVDGATLLSQGYDIDKDDLKKKYFIQREWNTLEEIYYIPWKCEENEDHVPKKDSQRTTMHNFGFVPACWIKNTPKSHNIDGECSFGAILETCITIDYQLSQLGRLLQYNSDPTLVVKNPGILEGTQLIKSVGAINLDEKGDAYLLEMSNSSTNAVIDYVRCLREFALECVRGNRANPDKLSAIHSGKALQMLNSPLISFVDELRLSYGENGLMRIYYMILDIYKLMKGKVDTGEYAPDDADCKGHLKLDWPEWYPATPEDKLQQAQALSQLRVNKIMSEETAVTTISDEYDIIDIPKELAAINEERTVEMKNNQEYNSNSKRLKTASGDKDTDVDRQ